MPTNTEIIRELDKAVADFRVRLDVTDELKRRHDKLADEVKVVDRELAALKALVGTLVKQLDRAIQQRFTIVIALVSAFVGGSLTFLAQLGLRYLAR